MSDKWKIDWRGNIVPAGDPAPSVSPEFDSPREAQAYIARQPVRVYGGETAR
jgi:hypothetical protein